MYGNSANRFDAVPSTSKKRALLPESGKLALKSEQLRTIKSSALKASNRACRHVAGSADQQGNSLIRIFSEFKLTTANRPIVAFKPE